MKSWRYQIIGGYCVNVVVKYVLGTYIIRLEVISLELWHPSEFTSDLLVLNLVSFKSLENIMVSSDEEETGFLEGDYALVIVKLVFMNLHLHAINID